MKYYVDDTGSIPLLKSHDHPGFVPAGTAELDFWTAIQSALSCIRQYGGIDGGHHKQWVLDQVVRELTGPAYAEWVREQKDGEDGPDTYEWDEGIAP